MGEPTPALFCRSVVVRYLYPQKAAGPSDAHPCCSTADILRSACGGITLIEMWQVPNRVTWFKMGCRSLQKDLHLLI